MDARRGSTSATTYGIAGNTLDELECRRPTAARCFPDHVDTDIRAYDGKNKHGGSQGAVLKTSIL